jgi:hypothetical protein
VSTCTFSFTSLDKLTNQTCRLPNRKRTSSMAFGVVCGTCRCKCNPKSCKKLFVLVHTVHLKTFLTDCFNFSPKSKWVCTQCFEEMTEIIRLNKKLEEIAAERDNLVTDFRKKLSLFQPESEPCVGLSQVFPNFVLLTIKSTLPISMDFVKLVTLLCLFRLPCPKHY